MRTDCHRPGAIIPAHYRHVLSYNLPLERGEDVLDAENLFHCEGGKYPCEGTECCVEHLESIGQFVGTGGRGKCSVCGARFNYGDVFQYTPTGEYLHMGHECSSKYAMMVNRSAWELKHARAEQALATQIQKRMNAEAVASFLAKHEGLEAALEFNHYISRDLKDKLRQYHSLSEKQIALAFKLASEPAKVEEAHATAPTGKGITFEGEVVSVKAHESDFGVTMKMTVKVTTPEGTWLAWSTIPAAVGTDDLKGKTIRMTANLEPGSNNYFVFAKRPRGVEILTPAEPVKETV